jgi:xylulokinase
VVFRPFLTGERGGIARPSDRGGWSGLHPGTTRADLARAAVEGVVFAIGAAFALLEVPSGEEPVVLTGGGARSPLVRQLLADVLGRPVRHLPLRSASAIGAAVLAGRGVAVDVVPEPPPGAVLDPRADGEMRRASDRWARA